MITDYACYSNAGDREHNEDSIGAFSRDGCQAFVLADGLGGHGCGDLASKTVVETVGETIKSDYTSDEDFLSIALDRAQDKILSAQKSSAAASKMKTTAVLLYLHDQYVSSAYIGDSRLYYIRNNSIVRRTFDHSVPQMLAAAGEIKEKDIRHHEDRNRLLRALGTGWDEPRYKLDTIRQPIDCQDAFLLCSDGFWEWITEKEMEKSLKRGKSANETLNDMVKKVLKAGKGKNMDNFSAILIQFRG